MILIERYQRTQNVDTSTFADPAQFETVSGLWRSAWIGDDWDDEAREIAQMCNTNGDPMRVTFGYDLVRQ